MRNVRKLQPLSVNAKLSALSSLNKYLKIIKIQDDQVIHLEDYIPFEKGKMREKISEHSPT